MDEPMWEEKVYKQNLHLSPIGGIKIACFLHNGVGVLTSKRVLPHFTLVYVTRGQGRYRDERGLDLKVEAGDAIVVFPGREHWYGPAKGETWDEFYLVFEGPVFDMWREVGCFDRDHPVIPLKPLNFWRDRILQVIGRSQAVTESELLQESIQLQELLADIQQAGQEDYSNDIVWVEQAKAAVSEHLDIRVAACSLGYSYEAFRKRFRKLAGRSPGQFRTGLLMERACEMLSEPGILLRDIAEELGYCDEYHFSRQFSKTVGWSPTEYRSRVKREIVKFDEMGNHEMEG
ncbi:helix-turn-helix domain-containing protein [Altererythrobacter lutimaris]|uniref:Helix-turn-helix transcriptional regulator n=1 Tax=Altererythrobacter lutimaris TaxID=2743979 RepID=A0A850HA22_9SPHN|nr:AraC family transcriptional regulator [Altererythrobacter lutimaris]NVE93288.1 helix-turn-helix transcriptional regulator [Altererythrobacter lutimaris]